MHAPSQPASSAVPRYDLNIKLLPEADRLEATGTLWLPPVDTARESLALDLSDVMHDLVVQVLAPAESAGTARLERTGGTRWIVHPAQPITKGQPALLRFSYSGGEKIAFVFYVGPDGSFASGINTAWYPQLGKSRSIGSISFSVPAGYKVFSVGVERNSPEEATAGSYRFQVDSPTRFSFGVGKYFVFRRGGIVPVSVYLLHPRDSVDKYVDGCLRVLDLLVKEFGPYPHSGFALVEVPLEPASKAGFSGASGEGFIFANTPQLDQEFNTAYYGHEIGHQWWGNLVGFAGFEGASMLSEGMAQFGSLLAVQAIDGEAAAERYRRTGYPGYSNDQSGLGYLKLAAAGLDHPLVGALGTVQSHQLCDSKGFLVWDVLSRTVGRAEFSRVLHDITEKYAYKSVSWDQFLQSLQQIVPGDLSWLFKQWFEQTGAPDWQLTWKQEGKTLRGTISQTSPYYRATVELLAEGKDHKKVTRTLEVNGPQTQFTWTVGFIVDTMKLDPHFLVLHWTPEYRDQANTLIWVTRGYDKVSNGKSAEAYREFEAGLEHVPDNDNYGVRFELELGLARLLIKDNKMEEAKGHVLKALASSSSRPEDLPWAYYSLARAARALRDEPLFRSAIESLKAADAAAGGRTGAPEAARRITDLDEHK
jgi:hypothetical protein